MPSTRRPLFRGLNARQWLNLIWAAFFVFYIAFGIRYVLSGGLCDYMGTDYRAFLASAKIAHERGFAQVYNLETQTEYQRVLYEQCPSGPTRTPYVVVPMPYLPAFVLLFMPLLSLDFVPALCIWITVNVVILVLYMIRFVKALGRGDGRDILFQLIVCVPFFSNMFLGQVNGWLLICLGEFFLATMRAGSAGVDDASPRPWFPGHGNPGFSGFCSRGLHAFVEGVLKPAGRLLRDREFHGGMWLAGLLLKPQTLIILLPGLLLGRRFKALAGFVVTSLLITGVSLSLAGGYGIGDLVLLILNYVIGLPTNAPEAMMNWRGLAVNLGALVPHELAWGIAIFGMVLTVAGGISFWVRPPAISSTRFGIAMLGTYAATCAATWHSHVHMVLPLIPLVLFLYARRRLPWEPLYLWLFGPAMIFPVALVVIPEFAYNLAGVSMLVLNLYLLAWALQAFWRTRNRAVSP